jgi:hypothetical protein
MKKRVLAGLLWFYATWYAWGLIASTLGVTEMLGPVLGLIAAALFAGDPLGRIWSSTGDRHTVTARSAGPSEPA